MDRGVFGGFRLNEFTVAGNKNTAQIYSRGEAECSVLVKKVSAVFLLGATEKYPPG
ncbi:hypothetical protein TREPR_1679 [Treponema primitia ZAS-2]|uniref:Uncharacterized protein n=1 Tax=Treponema primitia (strain ATCC BAA-887 / DSM 12427 / ZAS-2) TaxID=545694 RepID=F5YMY8_TREPZ|nr:hypothetical protein TREPR_1679 [Treponema primitia ZAS-2]